MNSESGGLNRKIHLIGGGLVFLLSTIVYLRSVAPTTSFWDCGEFIACSRILGVMHPPGAPLYLLIGRIMTMFPFVKDIGLRVNIFSVFISSTTVLLTYLIIVQLIKRWRGEAQTFEDRLILYGSAIFGAVSFAFTDSFWFNAVEAEVYAFSMFFTAIVVWLALLWGERSERTGNLLLIFFIFYLFGLATGVHLLNILAYPTVLLIAFFHENKTVRRLLMLIFIQAVVPVILYILFFQFDPTKKTITGLLEHQANANNFLKWFGLFWIVATLVYFYRKDRKVFNAWWVIPILVILAYSTYLAIYIRAGLAPPINENDPSTMQGMMDYLARKQYGEQSLLLTFVHRNADFWNYQIHKMYTRYFGWQFIGKGIILDGHDRVVEIISLHGLYGIPFIVGLWGAVHHFFKDWKRALGILVLFILTGYAIILYLNQPDPQPRERDYSYVGSFFAFALWIGVGWAGVMEWIAEGLRKESLKKGLYAVAAICLLIAVPLNLYAFNSRAHSRSGNFVAWDYSYNILQSCESDAIIFTNGDNDTFPLWYLQEVEGIRKDVRVVNLSLLNTAWYIKQLRDAEPKVPVRLGDQAIENLRPMEWQTQDVEIPVPQAVVDSLQARLTPAEARRVSTKMKFSLAPTFANDQGIRVQDLMVLRILMANQWKRPVYFAMTVSTENKMGMDPFMRMDGLAFRVMPYSVQTLDTELLRTNLLEKFQFRNLNNEKVFYNPNILKLLQNYRSAFMELTRQYVERGLQEEAHYVLDEMEKRMPETIIPYADERHAVVVSNLYQMAGGEADVENRVRYTIPGKVLDLQERLALGSWYAQFFQDWDRSEEIFAEIIQEYPNEVQAVSGLFQMYRISRQYDKAITLLENWMMQHPRDRGAELELENLRKLVAQDTTASMQGGLDN